MKLLGLTLTNYIGIYNGMGLETIHIPFKECKSSFVIIKGDNGSGKSTIFKALSPFCDSAENIIYNRDGYKRIDYLLDDASILSISYVMAASKDSSNVWHHKSTCSIRRIYPDKEPMELNPSGNITSGKEIIYNLFQLDNNFMVLSELSATNKGIGSQTPTERKKYVNSIVTALDDFIELNVTFSKKSNIVKSLLNNISTKLSQIGDIKIIESSMVCDQESLNNLEARKNGLIKSTTKYKTQLDEINKEGNIIENYASYTRKLMKMQSIKPETFFTYPDIRYNEGQFLSYHKELTKEDTVIEMNQSKINTLLEEETQLVQKSTELAIRMESDNKLPEIEQKLIEINKKMSEYEQIFYSANIPKAIFIDNKDTYRMLVSSINSVNALLEDLYEQFFLTDIERVLEVDTKLEFLSEEKLHKNNLNQYILEKESLEKIRDQDDIYIEQSAQYNDIPAECQLKDTCIFVKNIVEASKKVLDKDKRQEIDDTLDTLNNRISFARDSLERLNTLIACSKDLKNVIVHLEHINRDLVQFLGTTYFKNKEDMKHFLSSGLKLEFDTSTLNTCFGYLDIIQALQHDKETLEATRKEIMEKQKNDDILKTKLEIDKRLDALRKEKAVLQEDTRIRSNKKISLESSIYQMQVSKDEDQKYKEFTKELKDLTYLVEEMQDKANQALELTNKYNTDQKKLAEIVTNNIPMLNSRIEKSKYQLTIYEQYKQEFDTYSDLYKKLVMLRDKSSIHGIQSVYIEAFMNSILQLTNQLLQMLFQGRFAIKEFIVNNKEFSIPCIDSEGQERPDITYMSDSQLSLISMIISFVLLHKATGFYKIIKLDEVDANLDNTNRLQFTILIQNMLNILHFDQCIIISHNNEISMDAIDMVVLRVDSQSEYNNLMNSGANIIYSYNNKK